MAKAPIKKIQKGKDIKKLKTINIIMLISIMPPISSREMQALKKRKRGKIINITIGTSMLKAIDNNIIATIKSNMPKILTIKN